MLLLISSSKFEYRNPKQIRMFKIAKQDNHHAGGVFGTLDIRGLEIV